MNHQLQLHDKSIKEILAVLRDEKYIPDKERRETIANTIEAQI